MTTLAGKDYFTEDEAALYCGMSKSHFRKNIEKTSLRPGRMWGKKLYRRADLQKLIEETAWQPSAGDATGSNQAA